MGSRHKSAVGRRPPRPKGEYGASHQPCATHKSGLRPASPFGRVWCDPCDPCFAPASPRWGEWSLRDHPGTSHQPADLLVLLHLLLHFEVYFYTLYKTLTICHHSAGGCPSLLAPSGHRGEAEYATQPGAKHQYGQDQPRPEGCGADCGASWPNYKSLPVGCNIISLPHI